MNGLKDWLLALIVNAMTGFDNMVSSAEAVLTGSDSTYNIAAAWDTILGLSTALKPFCYVVITLCLLIELAQVAIKLDMIKWEAALKVAVKMVLAKVIIDVAPTFLEACYLQANEWITEVLSVGDYQSMGGLMTSGVEEALAEVSGFWTILGLFVSVMIVALAIKICGLLVQVIALGRMFELYIYLAVSPFPCAFFPLGDGTGGGFSRITQKYFKSFIAVCLQGVMMVLCIRIFYIIMGTAFSSLVDAAIAAGDPSSVVSELCYTMLMCAIVLIMSISKCGSWAKGIMDVM